MKLQKTTLLLMFLALSLGGLVYWYETQAAPQRVAAKAQDQQIFDFEEDQIESITIKKQEQTLKFERVDQKIGEKARISPWQMKIPVNAIASDAAVSYLLDLLVKGKSDRLLTVSTNQRQEYGLDKPLATIEVKLKDQKEHKLILGKPDFSGSFLYAQADLQVNTPQKIKVLLVSKDFENAVQRPLSEWQNKEETNKNSEKSRQSSPSSSP